MQIALQGDGWLTENEHGIGVSTSHHIVMRRIYHEKKNDFFAVM